VQRQLVAGTGGAAALGVCAPPQPARLMQAQWGTIFGDAPCLSALVDRFAQHCHVLDIDADSWRDKERLEKKASPAVKRKR
jgi:hypothetical protein